MGGAIFSLEGQVTVSNSTLSGNTASGGSAGGSDATAGVGAGGAIFNVNGAVVVSGSTIAGNTLTSVPSVPGGGEYNLGAFHRISDGGATTASLTISGSILFGNTGDDISVKQGSGDTSASAVQNVSIVGVTDNTGGTVTGSPITSDPLLGTLAASGTNPQVMKPGAGSPALGAGVSCNPLDELGTPRPSSGCDLGAYQTPPAPPATGGGSSGGSSGTPGTTTTTPPGSGANPACAALQEKLKHAHGRHRKQIRKKLRKLGC
jgi:hypothetical protein